MDGEFIDQIVKWVTTQPVVLIYLTVTIIAYVENIFPPIPGDLIVVFAGYLVAQGTLSPVLSLLLFTVASIAGFMSMYVVGYYLEDAIKKRKFAWLKFFDGEYLDKGMFWMMRYGNWVVLANRFLAGTRSIISISAGMARLNVAKTVISSGASAILWNGILLYAGWLVQTNWKLIGKYLSNYGTLTVAIIVLILVFKWGIPRLRQEI